MFDFRKIAFVGALLLCGNAKTLNCNLFSSHPKTSIAAAIATAAGVYGLNEFVHKKFAAWKKKQQANFSKKPARFSGKTIVTKNAAGEKITAPDLSFITFAKEFAKENAVAIFETGIIATATAVLVAAAILSKKKQDVRILRHAAETPHAAELRRAAEVRRSKEDAILVWIHGIPAGILNTFNIVFTGYPASEDTKKAARTAICLSDNAIQAFCFDSFDALRDPSTVIPAIAIAGAAAAGAAALNNNDAIAAATAARAAMQTVFDNADRTIAYGLLYKDAADNGSTCTTNTTQIDAAAQAVATVAVVAAIAGASGADAAQQALAAIINEARGNRR